MKVKVDEIKKLCVDVLLRQGVNREDAEVIVAEYLYGELSGKKSHGLMAFPDVLDKLRNIGNGWKVVKEDKSFALIDGKKNIGQVVGKFAVELAIKKALGNGLSLVGINNMFSYLMPGYYAKMIAVQDMIGIVLNNGRSRVAPFGGIESKLGTNPLAIAFPTQKMPFVLDMATSKKAMGEVRLARYFQEELKEDFALDKNGKATKDPEKVKSLLPFGGYKGYGLAIAIEVLAGTLVRAKMGKSIVEKTDRGYVFMVINPEIFVNIETFKSEVSELLKDIKRSRKEKGVKEILIPGERAQRRFQKAMRTGVFEVESKVVEDIRKLLK